MNSDQHSRRLFLTAGSAGVVFGALSAAAAAEVAAAHDDAELLRLGEELEEAQKARESFDFDSPDYDAAADEASYELHWKLRERIDAIQSQSLHGLAVKARAAEIAISRDEDCLCLGPGSFIGLVESLTRDIRSLAQGDAAMVTAE